MANGVGPVESKRNAETAAAINDRTFKNLALDWHRGMCAKWAPPHSKTVLSRLKTHVFPLIGARAIVDLA
ncbi:Integrase [Pseudomonas syringae pv. apii]|nr:Integrase [Pseudomonas syringae pv. apii]